MVSVRLRRVAPPAECPILPPGTLPSRWGNLVKRIAVCLILALGAGTAHADTAFQFALPAVRVPDDAHVNGMRVSILHGRAQSIRGFDLGLVALSETRDLSGVSLVAGLGKVDGDMSGVAISLVNIHKGNDTGLNAAFVNRIHAAENAVDVGFVNIADAGTMFDLGGVNVSKRSAVQLGFINVTKQLRGFQFGFINMAENGFLPVFPVFNFPKPSSR